LFLEAQWKQVRTLYMLHARHCLKIPKELLALVAAFLTEPIRPRPTAQEELEDGAIRLFLQGCVPPRYDDMLIAMPFC
jgi:hypothetical protein